MRDERQRRTEQHGAGAEERGGLIDGARGPGGQQAQARHREHDGQHPSAAPSRGPITVGHVDSEIAREQAALGHTGQAAKGPPDAQQRGGEAPQSPARQRRRADVHAERGRADRINPPRAQAGDDRPGIPQRTRQAQHAACQSEHGAFLQEHPAHVGDAEPHRSQQAHLAHALLDAELEEERRQQQRRHHQEEAEVDEVLAEVGGAARRRQRLAADVPHGQARCQRIQARAHLAGQGGLRRLQAGVRVYRHANRGDGAVAVAPQALARFERNERLRRGPVLVPVGLVLRPHASEVDGKRGVPVVDRGRIADPRVVGGHVAIAGGDRHDGRDGELGGRRDQPPGVFPQVVVHRQAIADLRTEVPRRPLVEHDRRRATSGLSWKRHLAVHGRHQRVRDFAVADAQRVGEIREHWPCAAAGGGNPVPRRPFLPLVQQPGGRLDGDGLGAWQRPHPDAHVVERGTLAHGGLQHLQRAGALLAARLRGRQGREDRVDPSGNLEVLLQTGQRHEDGAHLALLWPQRELADGGARQHPAHGDAHRAAQVFLARVQRLDRNRRRTLQPDQQRGAVTDGKLGSQRGAQEGVPVGRAASPPPSGGSARSDRPRRRPPRRRHAGRRPARSRNPAPPAAARTTRIAPRRRGRRRYPSLRDSRKNVDATTAWSVRPSRSVTSALRLARTDSPTMSAPVNTATAVATPSTTARLVRQ